MTFKEAFEKNVIDLGCIYFEPYCCCCGKEKAKVIAGEAAINSLLQCNCTIGKCKDYKRASWETFVNRCEFHDVDVNDELSNEEPER